MPAGGPPRGEAGSGLPRAVAVPGLLLPLPPALGVPAVVRRCPRGECGDLKAVIKDAESKLPVPLRQREEVLVHILWGEGRDHRPWRGPPLPPEAQDSKGAGAREGNSGLQGREDSPAPGVWPWAAATHLEGLPALALLGGRRGGGGVILCVPARTGQSAPPSAPCSSGDHLDLLAQDSRPPALPGGPCLLRRGSPRLRPPAPAAA